MARVFDHDPLTGQTTYFHYDHTDGSAWLETKADVSPIIELNKALYAATDERAGWKGDGFHSVARIPMTDEFAHILFGKKKIVHSDGRVGYELLPGDDAQKQLLKFLNDSDNRLLRTRPGKL